MSTRKVERALARSRLQSSFSTVPLGLKLVGTPIAPGNASIVQMDINKSQRFGEYFRIWLGASDNEVEVLATDSALLQLVLRVKEPRRPVIQVVRKNPWTRPADVEERARAAGGRILSETRQEWRLQLWTPEEERRFLCGKDDLHLFAAQVPAGDTVAQAQASLKPRLVQDAEALWPGQVKRQGEWFFLPVSAEEEHLIDEHQSARPRGLKLRHPIGESGQPHVADKVIAIDRHWKDAGHDWRWREIYAQGLVTHPDHRDLHLDEWRKVIRNREIRSSLRENPRLRWID
jgi:hypothetical protein